MALPKSKFREGVFQLLFSTDFSEHENEDLRRMFMKQLKASMKEAYAAIDYLIKIKEKVLELDRHIQGVSSSYEIDRISKVELNILRLSIYEMKYNESVPGKVAIAEAIRLCRKFSTAQGAKFVNAILDAIFKENAPA